MLQAISNISQAIYTANLYVVIDKYVQTLNYVLQNDEVIVCTRIRRGERKGFYHCKSIFTTVNDDGARQRRSVSSTASPEERVGDPKAASEQYCCRPVRKMVCECE